MQLTVRNEEKHHVVYDHQAKRYCKYSSFSEIEADFPKEIASKQFREVFHPYCVPLKVFFDVTAQCNSKCLHCYNESGKKQPEEISLEQIAQMAQEMHALGICQVSIAGGEPFLRKDIFDIIRIFREHQIDVSITTNGLCLSEQMAVLLKSLDIKSLTVSIDGINREKYREIRGVDKFEQLNDNLEQLRKHYHGELAMRFSVMKGNCNPQKVIEYAVSKKFDCLKVNKTHVLGRFFGNQQYLIDDATYDAFIAEFATLEPNYPIILELPREKYLNEDPTSRCSAGKKTIYVSPQGKIFPCPFITTDYQFGSLNTQTLEDTISTNQSFNVVNSYCAKCPAMKKSHNITKQTII